MKFRADLKGAGPTANAAFKFNQIEFLFFPHSRADNNSSRRIEPSRAVDLVGEKKPIQTEPRFGSFDYGNVEVRSSEP